MTRAHSLLAAQHRIRPAAWKPSAELKERIETARAGAAAKACFQEIMTLLHDHLDYNISATAESSLHSQQGELTDILIEYHPILQFH